MDATITGAKLADHVTELRAQVNKLEEEQAELLHVLGVITARLVSVVKEDDGNMDANLTSSINAARDAIAKAKGDK